MDSCDQTLVLSLLSQIDRVRNLSQIDILTDWYPETYPGTHPCPSEEGNKGISLNEKGYVGWERGRQEISLEQQIVFPQHINGYPIAGLVCRLALTWWAELAQVFVNGELVEEGDLFDHSTRIVLTPAAVPGSSVNVQLRLVSPGHDVGALMRSRLIFESLEPAFPEPGWLADELAVLVKQLAVSQPTSLAEVGKMIGAIDYDLLTVDSHQFTQHLLDVKQRVKSVREIQGEKDLSFVYSPGYPEGAPLQKEQLAKIKLLGHAHLDMAWLWEVAETWEVAERTFNSAVNLQQEYPQLTFCHSTPALYEWIEINKPELFDRIEQQIQAGKWEVVGGMWIEPDLNLISGESIARQIIYGQRYNQSKFGKLTKVAWLPDTFGFCWQLPQLLLQGSIEYFVTQKFQWNDTTKFPHQLFWWEAPDGSRVLSLMSSAIGEGIDPLKMIDYACGWEQSTGINESLWLFGVGDHGGGPTRDMLELASRWSKSDVFPDLEFTTAVEYLDKLVTRADSQNLPVWKDELYLEFHRGCLTTHADQKLSNRRCEDLLYQAELWSVIASVITQTTYPDALKLEIETAWKQTLFNQFHDIIPGTAIEPVYATANQGWEFVELSTTRIIRDALNQIAENISLPTPPTPDAIPIVIFNALNWSRTEVVSLSLTPKTPLSKGGWGDFDHFQSFQTDLTQWQIYNAKGELIPSQTSTEDILFLAADLPSVGYGLFWLVPKTANLPTETAGSGDFIFKNQYVRVTIDPQTGDIKSLWDEVTQREVFGAGGGNQLQAFRDSEQYWDAWNIDPKYAEHRLPSSQLKSIRWIESGAIRQRLRVVRVLADCEFSQDYILDSHSPIVQIQTTVDWQAEHILVKANFSLNLTADKSTAEIACGAIERTTKPTTDADRAKWEVPMHKWVDLTDSSGDYGVSLLNDCKYGYDAGIDYLRLTLLRSSKWPDLIADRGYHQFTYSIYPHSGTWQVAQTVRKGYELNCPLQVLELGSSAPQGCLPAVGSLLDIPSDNLILMAFKPSDQPTQAWVLRCYECHGLGGEISLGGELDLKIDQVVNLFDEPVDKDLCPSIAPWQIRSYGITLGSPPCPSV